MVTLFIIPCFEPTRRGRIDKDMIGSCNCWLGVHNINLEHVKIRTHIFNYLWVRGIVVFIPQETINSASVFSTFNHTLARVPAMFAGLKLDWLVWTLAWLLLTPTKNRWLSAILKNLFFLYPLWHTKTGSVGAMVDCLHLLDRVKRQWWKVVMNLKLTEHPVYLIRLLNTWWTLIRHIMTTVIACWKHSNTFLMVSIAIHTWSDSSSSQTMEDWPPQHSIILLFLPPVLRAVSAFIILLPTTTRLVTMCYGDVHFRRFSLKQ